MFVISAISETKQELKEGARDTAVFPKQNMWFTRIAH